MSVLHQQSNGGTLDVGYGKWLGGETQPPGRLGACSCAGMYSTEWLAKVHQAFGALVEPRLGHYYDCTDLLAKLHGLGGDTALAPATFARKEKFPRDFRKDARRRYLEVRNKLWIIANHYAPGGARQAHLSKCVQARAREQRPDVAERAIFDADRMQKLTQPNERTRWLDELDGPPDIAA